MKAVGLVHCATCVLSALHTFNCSQGRAAAVPPADDVQHHCGRRKRYHWLGSCGGKRGAVPAILSCRQHGIGPGGKVLLTLKLHSWVRIAAILVLDVGGLLCFAKVRFI